MQRTLCLSVDLDAIRHYRAIHGCTTSATEPDRWLTLAIGRLAAWAEALAIPITWFVVGRDLDDEDLAAALLGLYRRGHELANHSLDHFYDLTRRGSDIMREQVRGAAERLTCLTGKSGHGFRAPGYVITDALVAILRELEVPYDSSVFPCPTYYATKAVALYGQRILARQSHAIQDAPTVLRAPTLPYRMGGHYYETGLGLRELPIQVTRALRLPFIGTSITLSGPVGAKLLTAMVVGEPFVNLELHAIDALDAADELGDLARLQPDLRIPWRKKLDTLAVVVRQFGRHGYRCSTLEAVALGLESTG